MQRGTRFYIFGVFLEGARWAKPGRPKRCKTNDFNTLSKKKARQQMHDQELKIYETSVFHIFLEALWDPCWVAS